MRSHSQRVGTIAEEEGRHPSNRPKRGRITLSPGGRAKSKDCNGTTSSVLCPYLVTPDEVNFESTECIVRFNREEVTKGGAADMQFTREELIEYISQDEMIYLGEVLGSGTIGNGSSIESDRWLKPGDELEL